MFNPVPPRDPDPPPRAADHREDDYGRYARFRRELPPEEMSPGEWILAILCSGIGCIVGIVYLAQGNPKAGKMIGISLAFALLWAAVRVLIAMSLERG